MAIQSDAVFLANILQKKRWSIIKSENPVFVTSDKAGLQREINGHKTKNKNEQDGLLYIFPRHYTTGGIKGKLLICYNEQKEKNLRELNSLYIVYIRDIMEGFRLTRTVALTKNQKKILKSIDKKLLSCCSG
ncbi:molecular chaperone [Candidatus Scalindua japonica]|uniref:Molecular chaperone n=1 Tax=Candidatus Scalindua japonica TaxID=1284222 RepID=A0A286TXV4_9BACT|nr:hypothetical protein [Candidatus Scalindua japonica]GAX60694.1 molecular chaperone [Candidatus Scalindua japonica]